MQIHGKYVIKYKIDRLIVKIQPNDPVFTLKTSYESEFSFGTEMHTCC